MHGLGQMNMPPLGFGTYTRKGEAGIAAMLAALEAGCRHLDTAQSYDTEAETGQAVARAGLPRGEVFVTTKIDTPNFGAGLLIPSLEQSLRNLGLDQVDLTLIHWPSPQGEVELEVYLTQLGEAQARGLTRHIGVSNFPIALVDRAEAILGAGAIACNQIELNPHFKNARLAAHCAARGITVTCYQPIARGRLAGDATLAAIAAAHDSSIAHVALAWELAKGYAAIPTTSRPERARANMAAASLTLSPAEIATIDALPDAPRHISPSWMTGWDV